MADRHDIVIIGGGPVGAALALALRHSGLAVLVLEARAQPVTDHRPLALSHGSRLILERLDLWDDVESTTAITRILISQRGGFGRVALSASDAQVPALGYVADYASIASACLVRVRSEVDCHEGVRVTALHTDGESPRVDYENQQGIGSVEARLVVVADGGAALPGVAPQKVVDYRQHALTALIRTALSHEHVAYERFTPGGPLAMLPYEDCYALVWTLSEARAAQLAQCGDTEFLAELQTEFGHRRGKLLAVSQRACYPLSLKYIHEMAARGVVMIGNAAQTLHPVAGQGFNLGLRDAWELAQCLRTTPVRELGNEQMLCALRNRRRTDRYASVVATDGLVRLFSNDFIALPALRDVGMTLLGCVPPARDFLARRMIFGARG